MAMKLSAIVLIGIVLISIYIKNNDEGLVLSRSTSDKTNNFSSTQSLIENSVNSSSFRILEYPNQIIDAGLFLESIVPKVQSQVDSTDQILFVFWATWCPNCKETLLNLNSNLKNQNLKVFAINLDVKEDYKKAFDFYSSLNLSYETFYDFQKSSLKTFNIEILPTYSFIINDRYLYRIEGRADWSDPRLQKIISNYE